MSALLWHLPLCGHWCAHIFMHVMLGRCQWKWNTLRISLLPLNSAIGPTLLTFSNVAGSFWAFLSIMNSWNNTFITYKVQHHLWFSLFCQFVSFFSLVVFIFSHFLCIFFFFFIFPCHFNSFNSTVMCAVYHYCAGPWYPLSTKMSHVLVLGWC